MGYDQALNLPESDKGVRDSIKQLYNYFEGKIGFKKHDTSKVFNYDTKLNFGYIKDDKSAKEMEMGARFDLSYRLPTATIIAPVEVFVTQYANDSLKQNRNFVNVTPLYSKVKEGRYKYELGFNFNYENDIFSAHKQVHLYPVLRANYVVSKKRGISLFAGVEGGMKRTSFHGVVDQNPYLNKALELRNENTKINIYGGTEGKLAKYFTYNLTVGYKNIKNLALFMNDSLDVSKFNLNYEEGNTGVFSTKAELYFSKIKKVQFGLIAQYNSYKTPNYSKAFHRPAFTGKFISKYKIKDNFHLTADVYYISGLYAYDYTNAENIKLNAIADLNVGAEYFLNKKFSVFGSFNNLLNKSYEQYRNYNAKKFNFIMGLTYAF